LAAEGRIAERAGWPMDWLNTAAQMYAPYPKPGWEVLIERDGVMVEEVNSFRSCSRRLDFTVTPSAHGDLYLVYARDAGGELVLDRGVAPVRRGVLAAPVRRRAQELVAAPPRSTVR
jgi:hypothetical protein